jgi:hypothetical protein
MQVVDFKVHYTVVLRPCYSFGEFRVGVYALVTKFVGNSYLETRE